MSNTNLDNMTDDELRAYLIDLILTLTPEEARQAVEALKADNSFTFLND